MKSAFAFLFIATAVSSNAFAGTKTCYGSTKDDGTKGQVLTMTLNYENVVLSGDFYNGTYPALAGVVEAHSGVTYLQYKGESGDQSDIILVDKELMRDG